MSSDNDDDVPGFTYERIEGIEWLERYRPGGYHPVLIGQVLHGYRVVYKLGHGTSATIWLARHDGNCTYHAVKVGTADSRTREAETLRVLSDCSVDAAASAMIPAVHDEFDIQGPNGIHRCLVTTPARSSVSAASFARFFKLETARALAAQLVLAVAYTHARGFVHGDIHLGNALISLPSNFDMLSISQLYKTFGEPYMEPVRRLDGKPLPPGLPVFGVVPVWLGKKSHEISPGEARLILSDFAESFSPSLEKRNGRECRAPRPYMPPEAYFEPDGALSFPSDIWTLACAIWSLLTPKPLFDATLATAHDIVSQQVDKLGPLPTEWWDRWKQRHEYFDDSRRPKVNRPVSATLESSFETGLQHYRRKDKMGELCESEAAALMEMLRSMLKFRPGERTTAEQIVVSDWMVKWALPELDKVPRNKS